MIRRLRVLLAFALVPVVVLATPQVADAAVVYGDPVTSSKIDLHHAIPFSDIACTVDGYYAVDGDSERVKFKARCSKDWNAKFGGYSSVTFRGIRSESGSDCAMHETVDVADGAATFSGAADLTGGTSISGGCEVSEVCLDYKSVRGWSNDFEYDEQCAPMALGDLPDDSATGGCPLGSPSAVFTNAGYQVVEVKITSTSAEPVTWAWKWKYNQTGILPSGSHNYIEAAPGTDSTGYVSNGYPSGDTWLDGIEVYAVGWSTNNYNDSRSSSSDGEYPPAVHTNDDGVGWWGITDQSRCRFFIGNSAIASDRAPDEYATPWTTPNGAPGTPAGPTEPVLDDPEEPTPSTGGCDFSITNPASWASGGICALVGLFGKSIEVLKGILSAVGSLVSAIGGIAGAILDGLVGLFVPDSSVLAGEVDGVRSAWDDTTIAKWKDAFTGQSFAMPTSGCTGIPVDLELPGGVPVDMSLGAACSGAMATAAQIVKLCVTAFLVIFGGVACVRGLGSGFGWNPGIGKGSDT